MIRRLLILIVFFQSHQLVFSQFRKYSNEFMNIGAGARAMAMGNAQIASVDDATAGYWNPSNLILIGEKSSAMLMHAEYFSGIAKYDYGSIAVPVQGNKRAVGFSFLRFAVDDIPNTLYLVQPDGSINYNNIQSFSSADYAFLFSYAQHLKTKSKKLSGISIGSNAKIIYRKVGSFAKSFGFGLDASVSMHRKKWNLALMAKDISTTFNAWSFSFSEQEKAALYLTNNNIPVKSTELTAPRLIFGGARQFKINKSIELKTEGSFDFIFDGKRNSIISSNALNVDPHFGVEAGIKKTFFVRAGISNFQKVLADADVLNQQTKWISQPSLGAGFNLKNTTIDYAFTNLANQENPLYTHVFSLKVNFVSKMNLLKKLNINTLLGTPKTPVKNVKNKKVIIKPEEKKPTNKTSPYLRLHF